MLFLADAVIHRGPFNSSSNFIADFGCSTEKLAVFRKELQETKSIQFQFRVRNIFELNCNLNFWKTFHVWNGNVVFFEQTF